MYTWAKQNSSRSTYYYSFYPNIAILRQIKKVLMPTKSETSLQMLIIVLSWRLTSLPPYGCRLDDCYHLEQAEEVPTPYKNILASICRTYSMNEVYLNIWHSLYQYIFYSLFHLFLLQWHGIEFPQLPHWEQSAWRRWSLHLSRR